MTRSRPSHRRERTGCRSHYRPTAAKSRQSARTKKAISFRFLPAILSLLKDYSREKCQSHGPLMAISCTCTGVGICRRRLTDWMLPLVIGLSGENSCLPIHPELNLLALFFPRPTAEPTFTATGGCFPIFTSSKGCSETRQFFAEGPVFSKIRRLPKVSFPDAVRTNPEGLNDHGDLSGFQVDGSGLQHAFVAFRKNGPGACCFVRAEITNGPPDVWLVFLCGTPRVVAGNCCNQGVGVEKGLAGKLKLVGCEYRIEEEFLARVGN